MPPRSSLPYTSRLALLLVALGLASTLSLAWGVYPIAVADVMSALGAGNERADPAAVMILTQVRAPRLVLALATGAVLGVSGAALQALFRNPLAEAGLIGVSGGAALGAAITLTLSAPFLVASLVWLTPATAFLGALAVTGTLFLLAGRWGFASAASLILAGIALGAICTAGISLLSYFADAERLKNLTMWMLGSFAGTDWTLTIPASVAGGISIVGLLVLAPSLNALALGEREAFHLGIDVSALRRRLIVLVALGVGAVVSAVGVIAFVGLIVPHLLRLWSGPDHRWVLPGSALLGALVVVLAEWCARNLSPPLELPVGAMTSLLGGPFFLWLLARGRTVL
ncbi:MAG: iron ABC transporter permease [Gammaproteobacteria bacterium]|nr:iron ABC transporter permease [Gammaproteobacteria bacterium]